MLLYPQIRGEVRSTARKEQESTLRDVTLAITGANVDLKTSEGALLVQGTTALADVMRVRRASQICTPTLSSVVFSHAADEHLARRKSKTSALTQLPCRATANGDESCSCESRTQTASTRSPSSDPGTTAQTGARASEVEKRCCHDESNRQLAEAAPHTIPRSSL